MIDRAVQFPNRYKIVQVPGQPGVFDLTPFPGEITEVGTPISKGTLLKDSTFSKFDNTEGTKNIEATPDGVFQALSRANASSIITVFANSNELSVVYPTNSTQEGFATFSNILYDATGKCTQNRIYIPKGIKRVLVSASLAFQKDSATFAATIYKNGVAAQSLFLRDAIRYDPSSTYTTEPVCVVNTTGDGTEYLQLHLKATANRNGQGKICCDWLKFQMLTY